jgi:hypothetical protein
MNTIAVEWSGTDAGAEDVCAAFLARHTAYRDGQLTPALHALHEAHAAECDACASYARVLDRGVAVLLAQSALEPSPEFAARLQHRIFHLEDRTLAPRRRYLPVTLAAASLAAVLALPRLTDPGAGAGAALHPHEDVFGAAPALWHAPPLPLAGSQRSAVRPVALYTPLVVQPPRYRTTDAN